MHNKSEIMRRAWELKKRNEIKFGKTLAVYNKRDFLTFGACLRIAWDEAKKAARIAANRAKLAAEELANPKTFTVAGWFVAREEMHANKFDASSIKKETKKAILVHDANGLIWIPKSIITYNI